MDDELIGLHVMAAGGAVMLDAPALLEQAEWRLGEAKDRRAIGDHREPPSAMVTLDAPATTARLTASARARWLRMR